MSNADEIQKLKELLDSGTITPEEFEVQKQKLLNPVAPPPQFMPPVQPYPQQIIVKKKSGCLTAFLIVAGIIILIIIIGAIATNNAPKDTNNKPSNTTTTASEKNTAYSIGETAALKDWEITVNSFEVVDEIQNGAYFSFTPKNDTDKFVVVDITVKNNGKKADSFLPYITVGNATTAKVRYKDYEFARTQLLTYDKELSQSGINPLSSITGVAAFSLEESFANSGELVLEIKSGAFDSVSFELKK